MTPEQYADFLIQELKNLNIHDVYIDELFSGVTQKEILKKHIEKKVAIFIVGEIKKACSGQEIEWYDAVTKILNK